MLDFSRFAELHPQVRQLCFDYFQRAQPGIVRDDYAGLMDLWVAFASWMACVSEADNDAVMVRDTARDTRLLEAYERLSREDDGFRHRVDGFSEEWPIFRSQDVVRFLGPGYPYGFKTRREFAASLIGDYRIRRSPSGWQSGSIPTWADLISAIYQVRCNLMHGYKSVERISDRQLVGSSYTLLLEYIEKSGCFDWT